ncbi:MAG: GNAT family N-acetyltransferase [Prochlorococcaceae cyanobacterium]
MIRPLARADGPRVTAWARAEGFIPGSGDLAIYRHTDRQGLWVGCLEGVPIGCIAGVRYNPAYGFIGLFLVQPEHRGRGYGVQLWRRAMAHLEDVACVGLEAAPDRIDDYAAWGFRPAAPTRRWRLQADGAAALPHSSDDGLRLLAGSAIPAAAVQAYDASREPSPRPHFLADWLRHPAGTVLGLLDGGGRCHGFGRIRPCLLPKGEGWRIGPLLADSPALAERLLRGLLAHHPGVVMIDAPAANGQTAPLLERLGFSVVGETLRMYRGPRPAVSLADVYGLACLELG